MQIDIQQVKDMQSTGLAREQVSKLSLSWTLGSCFEQPQD
jgi:hypothetical protein